MIFLWIFLIAFDPAARTVLDGVQVATGNLLAEDGPQATAKGCHPEIPPACRFRFSWLSQIN